METNMLMLEDGDGTIRGLSDDYSVQEYVDLACMVDPGRELKFDTQQVKKKNTIEVVVDSYKLSPKASFASLRGAKRSPPRAKGTVMVIYKEWLKKYLGYFDPGFYEYIMDSVEGTEVTVLPKALASTHLHDYQMQGKVVRHHEIVPLWKGHEVRILSLIHI